MEKFKFWRIPWEKNSPDRSQFARLNFVFSILSHYIDELQKNSRTHVFQSIIFAMHAEQADRIFPLVRYIVYVIVCVDNEITG